MLDGESKRVDAGWMLESLARSETSLNDMTVDGGSVAAVFSIWEYIDDQNKTSPVFFNFEYSSSSNTDMVFTVCAIMRVWSRWFSK